MDQCASLLMTGLGYAGTAAQKSRLASASAEDWRCVLDLARRQNVSAFLYHRLQATGVLPPAAVRDELKKDYLILSMRNARLYSALSGVLELLHRLRIDVIALKGVYLAQVVYGNVGIRSMNDIDLLVKKEDLPRVEKALTESGAVSDNPNRVITEETHHFGYKLPGSGIRVEIHWTLLSVKGMENDIAGLWKRSQPAVIAGVSARTLSPEDLLLHLCAHTAARRPSVSGPSARPCTCVRIRPRTPMPCMSGCFAISANSCGMRRPVCTGRISPGAPVHGVCGGPFTWFCA
jgi:hypothetical protein